MSAADWIEREPDGFPVGTIITHHAPTCDEVPGHYVQDTCTHWTETILIPMTEGPDIGELPATGSDLGGMVLLAVALVASAPVAWVADRVKRSGRRAP